MKGLYKSDEWRSLDKIDRAQLLLVIEGLKRGAIVGGNRTSFINILDKTGLSYNLNSDKYNLDPVFKVSRKKDLKEANSRYICLSNNAGSEDYDIIQGWLLGYPECCVEEYIRKRTPRQIEAASRGQGHLSYRFGQKLWDKINSEGSYPTSLDYRPPSFTPCKVDCPEATRTLSLWKETIEILDPEAGRELVFFNRGSYPEMIVHTDYLCREIQNRDLNYRLNCIRESL